MLYDENNEKAAQYLKQVVPKLVELNLPTNPVNYAIWYEYITGRNPSLNKELDSMLENCANISQEISRDIYYRYILSEDTALISKANGEIKKAYLELIESLKTISDDNQEFIDLLSYQAETITEDTDLETFQFEIKRAMEASSTMKSSSDRYQEKFLSKAKEFEKLKADFDKVRKESNTDALTQINNRKAFNETLQSEIIIAVQEKTPLCLAIIDIDHFKVFNDTYGHLTGDQVLRFVATMITKNIKGKDFAARFGGEEFAVVLPDTELKGALMNSENIRQYIAKNRIINKSTKQALSPIHISVGVAQYRPGEKSSDFIERADKALYQAKNTGRNQVVGE